MSMSMISEELMYFTPGLFYQWTVDPTGDVTVRHITVDRNVFESITPGKFFARSNEHPLRLFGPFDTEPTRDLLPAHGDYLVFQYFGWICDCFHLTKCVRHISLKAILRSQCCAMLFTFTCNTNKCTKPLLCCMLFI